jgi:glutaminase
MKTKESNILKAFNLKNGESLTEELFFDTLKKQGIHKSDPRISGISFDHLFDQNGQTSNRFNAITNDRRIVQKAIQRDNIIPDFESFSQTITEIFETVKTNNQGSVADYIPQLARVNPDSFAVSVCTVDGQVFSIGDYNVPFSMQSAHKPINYAIALEELGEQTVHKHIGKEPSGVSFNALTLDVNGLPHNPLINAGAIMSASLIEQKQNPADKFDHILDVWKELNGISFPSFNNSIYQSERTTADRNFALAYWMKENNAFPEDVNIEEVLDFYFQCCSIEGETTLLSRVAATFANSGINPFTNHKVFKPETVKNCLSMMYSCGMYEYSGEFAFSIGVPAKSGVSGAIWLVIPNVMGISIYAPKLDIHGNSIKGIAFAKELLNRYNFHNYDSLNFETQNKKDPRRKKYETKIQEVMSLIFAASAGDLDEIRRLHSIGLDLNKGDYDGRTALHLASAENQLEVVQYLIANGANKTPKDRWDKTPLSDAKKGKFKPIIELLTDKN